MIDWRRLRPDLHLVNPHRVIHGHFAAIEAGRQILLGSRNPEEPGVIDPHGVRPDQSWIAYERRDLGIRRYG